MSTAESHGTTRPSAVTTVATDVAYLRDRIVNVVLVGSPGAADREWALVDTGLPGAADKIKRAAEELFAAGARPAAIILTHGHFDHVGAVSALAEEWDAPVYAHEMELPYVTGRSSYPPPEPLVGGGMMAMMSAIYPRGPIDLGERVRALPADGSVPGMPGWRWIFTPGHAPGHVSLVRDVDRAMIAGDAFVTTKQESLLAALTQRKEVHGPPMYFTPDWDAAHSSLVRLAEYGPTVAITGHGQPMYGTTLQTELRRLAANFDELARPSHGRYRDLPAITDRNGVVEIPPPVVSASSAAMVGAAIGVAVLAGVLLTRRRAADSAGELAPVGTLGATAQPIGLADTSSFLTRGSRDYRAPEEITVS